MMLTWEQPQGETNIITSYSLLYLKWGTRERKFSKNINKTHYTYLDATSIWKYLPTQRYKACILYGCFMILTSGLYISNSHGLFFKGNGDSEIWNLLTDGGLQVSFYIIWFICSVSNPFLVMNEQTLHEKVILRIPAGFFFLSHSHVISEGNLN